MRRFRNGVRRMAAWGATSAAPSAATSAAVFAGPYAPKALLFPFTGFAPASRCAGTRSRAGSL